MLLILAGIATSLSSLLSYKALSMRPASYVATIERLSMVFLIVISILSLKEKFT
uniref:EamA family transporter n=1 Tax=Arcticibacter eurypsychrophilus TaxID=1434752 RepID=UPI001112DF4C